jgi:hypothetical protein
VVDDEFELADGLAVAACAATEVPPITLAVRPTAMIALLIFLRMITSLPPVFSVRRY